VEKEGIGEQAVDPQITIRSCFRRIGAQQPRILRKANRFISQVNFRPPRSCSNVLAGDATMRKHGAASRYNLFRRKAEQHLYCAVPEDRPVPRFVDGCDWEYRGCVAENNAPPAGFRDDAAAAAVRSTGYYIFKEHA
jgi:hypothetical protein